MPANEGRGRGGLEVPESGENLFESELHVVGEVVGMAQHPQVIRRTFAIVGVDGGAAPTSRNGQR
ncbi:hypothetical protein AZG88_11415 [Rhodococcus sp. LB1]|nr:hypothetical protein AZG88_11415 [Rhodococcus sp. LB1]PBC57955.1 hypothetical protein CJ177_08950 [Rhodococcus sp. ACPA1]